MLSVTAGSEMGGLKLAQQYELWLQMQKANGQEEEKKSGGQAPSSKPGLVMFMLKRMEKHNDF